MASLGDILAAVQNLVQATNQEVIQLKTAFPHSTATSSFITATGAISFNSSQPVAFMVVTSSSGAVFKIPVFT